MTFTAAPFGNRLMLGDVLLLASHGVIVAFVAQLCHRFAQQSLVFGGMRIMTGQATFLAQQWPMHAILVERLVDHIVMATTAEPDSFGLDLERGSRGGFHVTLVAHTFGDR